MSRAVHIIRGIERAVRGSRQFVVVIVTIAVIIAITHAMDGQSDGNSGTLAGGGGASIPLAQPAATGNCPDAQSSAHRVASLAALAGSPTVSLRLAPTAGCATTGRALSGYRARVRTAALTVTLPAGSWAVAGAQVHHALARALLDSLHGVYPTAHVRLVIRDGARTVVRDGLP